MKVAILTLHYGYNEGAILQAKALASLIEKLNAGVTAEIVDHRYPGKLAAYGSTYDRRRESLQAVIDEWLPLSEKAFVTDDRSLALDYCRENHDQIVIGSDVVWGLRYQRRLRRLLERGILPRQTDPFFPAYPNVYWPEQRHADHRIAYAASCGNLWWEDVPKRHRRSMARVLDGFAAIGYRDERTRLLIASLSLELAERSRKVPDPTIAFDLIAAYGGETARDRLENAGLNPDQSAALLVMKETEISLAIAKRLKEKGFGLIATGSHGGVADIDLNNQGLTPLEWAWLPNLAKVCVTERMHATIFSLLAGTPILALDMNDRTGGCRTKLGELMDDAGLEPWYLHQEDLDAAQALRRLEGLLATEEDQVQVQAFIERERQRGQTFLREALQK